MFGDAPLRVGPRRRYTLRARPCIASPPRPARPCFRPRAGCGHAPLAAPPDDAYWSSYLRSGREVFSYADHATWDELALPFFANASEPNRRFLDISPLAQRPDAHVGRRVGRRGGRGGARGHMRMRSPPAALLTRRFHPFFPSFPAPQPPGREVPEGLPAPVLARADAPLSRAGDASRFGKLWARRGGWDRRRGRAHARAAARPERGGARLRRAGCLRGSRERGRGRGGGWRRRGRRVPAEVGGRLRPRYAERARCAEF